MKGCLIITMKDCMDGFTLAGFQQMTADREGLLELLKEVVKQTAPGLVFVDERLLTESIMARLQLLEKEWGGAILSLPAPGRDAEPDQGDYGKRFISRVLGYQMKLS